MSSPKVENKPPNKKRRKFKISPINLIAFKNQGEQLPRLN